MTLVERDDELAFLSAALADATQGRGSTVLVSGPIATGTSALLDTFTSMAAEAEVLPLAAVAAEAETHLPLGVMRQLFSHIPLTPSERDRIRDPYWDGIESFGRRQDDRPSRELLQTYCEMLLNLAGRQPLAIIVDNVQHADAASLYCLSYLSRRIRNAGIVAAFGHSNHLTNERARFLVDLTRQPNSHGLVLRLLTAEGIRQLAEAQLGSESGKLVAADCHRVSGGNPLLAQALLDDHAAAVATTRRITPGAMPALVVAEGYERAVVSCLHRGEAELLPVAQGLAVLGSPKSLGGLIGLDQATVERALGTLEATGLLAAGQFRHSVARRAVLRTIGVEQRRALHLRAAELALRTGEPDALIADHLVAADYSAAPWTVPVLREAALLALAAGRPGSALDYLRLACRAGTDETELARLQAMLLRALSDIEASASRHHLDELSAAPRRAYLGRGDALVLARSSLWNGRFDDARQILTSLDWSDEAKDPEVAAELNFTYLWTRYLYPPFSQYLSAVDHEQPEANILSPSVRRRLSAAETLDMVFQGRPLRLVEAVENILRTTRPTDLPAEAIMFALLALMFGDQAARAAGWCDKFLQEELCRHYPARQATLLALNAEISLRQGRLPAAERQARRALDVGPSSRWGLAVGAPLSSLLTALTAMGRYDEAADQLNLPLSENILQSQFGLHFLHARGRYHLATGSLEAALSDFRRCGELACGWGMDLPGFIAWRNDAADALAQLGRHGEARRLLNEQLALCGARKPRSAGTALRLLAATQEASRRPALLRRSADLLRDADDRYELARTLTDLFVTYRALGEPQRARLVGRNAWTLARECQARPLLERLGLELSEDPAAPPQEKSEQDRARVVLSGDEQRTADLAAQGYTNREIADRLCISLKTVEHRLTRVYRKLNLSSRAELPQAMG